MMGTVHNLLQYKAEKAQKLQHIVSNDNGEALSERLQRIRASIARINDLMAKLRTPQNKKDQTNKKNSILHGI
jgi:hypothetical protein